MDELKIEEHWTTEDGQLIGSQEIPGELFVDLPQSPLLNIDWEVFAGNEETRDVQIPVSDLVFQLPPVIEVPQPRSGPPDRGNYAGPLGFEVQVSGLDINKKKYLYSHKLNRIYVDMLVSFPVQFRWQWREDAGLLVRATTVFAEPSDAEKRVERCMQHLHNIEINSGLEDFRGHVLVSTRPPRSEGIFYHGAASDSLSWYSVAVLVPARPPPGALHITHAYSFRCKNSCSSGINRRPIEVIFTLEDAISGEVVGRQSVGARVCSCPRRDLKKDEESAPASGKRARDPAPPALPPKRHKSQDDDVTVYTLPPIVGKCNYKLVLEIMKKSMLASTVELTHESSREVYMKHIDKCERALLEQSK